MIALIKASSRRYDVYVGATILRRLSRSMYIQVLFGGIFKSKVIVSAAATNGSGSNSLNVVFDFNVAFDFKIRPQQQMD